MSYQVEFEMRSNFLVATITGTNSAHAVMSYLNDVLEECQKRDCFRLLINEQLEGPRLDVDDVFQIVSDGAMRAVGVLDAVAFVDPAMGDMAKFAEHLAVNRGMPVKAFDSLAEAEQWLEGVGSEGVNQDFFKAK